MCVCVRERETVFLCVWFYGKVIGTQERVYKCLCDPISTSLLGKRRRRKVELIFEVENMRLGGIGSEFSQEMDKKNRQGKLGTKILGMHFRRRRVQTRSIK